ncbi:MAG: thioredoxin [Candidatus Omnitrophica bacterium]|nr:thioredoxin [Candidatus Omnitrophota bacterium]
MTESIITLTDENFESNIKHSTILVDFWASWCAPCNMVAPLVEEIAREYQDKIKVGKLNVDDNQVTAADFGIVSIPTIIIFKNGREEARIVGVVPKDRITEKIEYIVNR